MKPRIDIVIVGAGVVGMTFAAMLASGNQARRLRVTLIDAGAEPRFSMENDVALRVSAISTGSMKRFADLGVRESIVGVRACPYRNMRVWDAACTADGPATLCFDAADLALPELGYIVENSLLQQRLLVRLRALDVALRFQTAIGDIERADDGWDLVLDGGERHRTALLVGADGANSRVRASAGIELDSWHYAQAAVVTHAQPSRSHRNTAWQRFLPGGPLALLPLSDGRVSVVWSTSPEQAARLLEADDADFSGELGVASDFVLGPLRAAAARRSFPLRAQHARRYVSTGLALIGDAAHTVHPLAGQGANLGLADAAALAAVIDTTMDDAGHPGDLPGLRRYERARRGANQTMLYFVDGLNRMFASESPLFSQLRRGGMRLFNRSGPLRRRAMQVALGLD